MSRLELTGRLMRRWFTSIPFFILLGLLLGGLVSISVVPRPDIAVITISGPILTQTAADDILAELRSARDDSSIKAIVLQIDSPGGSASTIEPIYLDILQLRQHKPVVAYIGARGASGGYYIAVASNFIYAGPSSSIGSIGVIGVLPTPERPDENILTTGPFKASGGSRRKAVSEIATLKQQFIEAVITQRGDRLTLSASELSRAEVYTGTEGLRYGLIDDIGTRTSAIQKAAQLAHLRRYGIAEHLTQPLDSSGLEELKSRTNTVPTYYYLYFEQE